VPLIPISRLVLILLQTYADSELDEDEDNELEEEELEEEELEELEDQRSNTLDVPPSVPGPSIDI